MRSTIRARAAPSLIVIAGPPCSGKSTLARRLSDRLAWTHLEMDAIRRRLFPGGSQTAAQRRAAYKAMHDAARELLRTGSSVVVDATYGPARQRRAAEELAAATRTRLVLIECHMPWKEATDRFLARPAEHPAVDLDAERVRALATRYPYFAGGLMIDTTAPVSTCLQQIETYLAVAPPLEPDGAWSRSAVGRWAT